MLTLRNRIGAGASLWTPEGLSGACQNELTPQLVRRAAGALASRILEQQRTSRPRVVVAGDGRPLSVELLSAAAEAMRWAGCDVIETASSSSGAVVRAIRHFAADGGLLIGNVAAEARTASITFYGADGAPWSLGGSLDAVKASCEKRYVRSVRTAGSSERRSMGDENSLGSGDNWAPSRPFKIVFDSACSTLASCLRGLLGVGSKLIQPEPLPLPRPTSGNPARPGPTFRERREKMIARQVIADAADFGVWIDGIGEACTVVDDRGLPVPPSKLLALLSRCPFDETDVATDYVERTTREATFHRLVNNDAAIAGDDQGRMWHQAADGWQLDALLTLVRLLKLLGETNLPLRKLTDCVR